MIKHIQKRCGRCELLFDIPNIRESKAREALLLYYPCTHCGFVRSKREEINKSGRCLECFIPFCIIDEYSKGMCHRCYMKKWRNITKEG